MNATKGIIGLLLAVAALSACANSGSPAAGGDGSGSAGGGSGNVSGSVSPGTVAPGQPLMVTPVPGLHDVRPIRWSKVTAGPDRRSLIVAFWSAPCFDVDHVRLAEEADRVIVTLYVGIPASEGSQPCAQSAEYRGVKVSLSSPLGNRRVVDGAPATGHGSSGPGTVVSPSQPA